MNKIIMLIDRLINFITTTAFILIMLFGAYAIYDMFKVNDSAKMDKEIVTLKPNEHDYSIDKLKQVNQDVVGWLIINDTNIDYPVVEGKDNNEYLSKNYKKEFSTAGSIFLDYRNDDFKDEYHVIYGHNMNSDLMFSDIANFINADYFDKHKDGYLYTSDGLYKIEIYSYAKINAFSDHAYNLNIYKNKKADVINYFQQNSTFKRDMTFNETDKLILLSTCDNNKINERDVLFAKMYKTDKIVSKQTVKTKEQIQIKDNGFNFDISLRDILLFIMTFVVLIIFIILIIQKIKIRKNKTK